uniref:Uncharacterized protein n=1 Tax=Rhizophora mucronata TaxID=61149 RepID=A0A2P2Q898_RHIMU
MLYMSERSINSSLQMAMGTRDFVCVYKANTGIVLAHNLLEKSWHIMIPNGQR